MEANELIGAFATAFTNIINTEVAKATAELNTKLTAVQDELLRMKNGEVTLATEGRITEELVREIAAEEAEEALAAHNNAYDHDEFISEITEYDIEDAVRNVVGGMSFEVSVS